MMRKPRDPSTGPSTSPVTFRHTPDRFRANRGAPRRAARTMSCMTATPSTESSLPEPTSPELSSAGDPSIDGALILHGWLNRRPVGHWQRHLAETLAERGVSVAYPQLPDPDEPSLDAWLAVFDDAWASVTGRRRVVVTHSLGGYLLLNAIARGRDLGAHRAILVAPPALDRLLAVPELEPFGHHGVTRSQFDAAVAEPPVVVASDDDTWTTPDAARAQADALGGRAIILPGQAHFSFEDGYGRWVSMERFVLADASGKLTAR